MKRFVWILFGGLFLAPPGLALKPTPEPDARRSDLSNELGAFVEKAMNEGLLDPVGTAPPDAAPKALVAAPGPAPATVDARLDCSAPYPLDFAEFETLTRYSDIYAYREESPSDGEPVESGAGHPGVQLAKAYIALDLASEAAMTVKTARDQEAVAVYNLSVLLDGHAPAPASYFAELATCYPKARLWQSLALISQGEPSGGSLMETELTAFRQLPLQLRDRAAMIAIPQLDSFGDGTLAKLLLGAFSEEEIASSSQLRFSQAVLELGAGSPDAEQLIGKFLIQSRFQEAALSALVRHKRPVNDAVREILLDDMVNRIELAQQDADVRGDLRFVLDELSAGSMYMPMLKLAELPSMQSPAAREELTLHLAASVKRDLASEDSLRNLAAIEALIKDPGLLDAAPDREALFDTATVVAVRLGFGALGDALSDKAQGGEGVAEQRAVLAYRQKKFDEVFALASRYPRNQKINLIAARAAIDTNDRVRLAGIESRLMLDADTILALIEQDAAAGHWIVSEPVFAAAAKLTGEGQAERVRRVAGLKSSPVQPETSARLTMTSIPGKLSRTRESLQQLSGQPRPLETP